MDGNVNVLGCPLVSWHAGVAPDGQQSCQSVRRPLRILPAKRFGYSVASGQPCRTAVDPVKVPRRSHWARMAIGKAGPAGRGLADPRLAPLDFDRSQFRMQGNMRGAQFCQSGLSTVSAAQESGSGMEQGEGERSMIQPQPMLWSDETLSERLKALMTAFMGECVGRPAHPLPIGPGGHVALTDAAADREGRLRGPAGVPGGRRADSDCGTTGRSGWKRITG